MKKIVLVAFVLVIFSSTLISKLPALVETHSANIVVPDDYERIQWAIGNATDGDTILVRAGTYYEHVTINKSISLIGENRTTTIIDGNWTGPIIHITYDICAVGFSAVIHITTSNVSVREFTIQENDVAISIYNSNSNILQNNSIANTVHGISLLNSSANVIQKNQIDNNGAGICLPWHASSNIIQGNNITNNEAGIKVQESNSNIFYHNNFVENIEQVYCSNSTNIWDDGYPSGGNFWSDYAGVDLYSGQSQNETGSDGIRDAPYVINAENEDRYPLIKPQNFPDLQLVYNEFYKLLVNHAELQSSYDNLEASYNNSSIRYNSLQAELNDLQSKYNSLTNELNITRNIVYALVIATIVFIATTVYLALRKPKVKSELETA